MKKYLLIWVIISLYYSAWSQCNFGAVSGTFNGVPAYTNCPIGGGSTTYNTSTGINTGYKWQCVEYVNRYYYVIYGMNIKSSSIYGNAHNYWQNSGHTSIGLTKYSNGGSVGPQVGDMIVSTSGEYGHIAIVTSVTSSSVGIIDQNFSSNSSRTLSRNGNTVAGFSSSYPIVGWIRKNGAQNQSISFSSPNGGVFASGQNITITHSSSGGSSAIALELISCSGSTTTISVIANSASASGTRTFTLPSLSNGQYKIKAYVVGTTGQPFYSNCFTVNNQAINVTSPSGGTYNPGNNITVTHSSSGGTMPVALELISCTGSTATIASIESSASSSGTRSYTLPNLSNGQYKVKAYVVGTSGLPYYSNCFTVASLIPATTPSLISPNNGAAGLNNPITFTWSSSNANEYRVQIIDASNYTGWSPGSGFSSDCSGCIVNQGSLSSTSVNWSGAQPGKTYYWTVRANGPGGPSNFSSYRTFNTQAASVSPPTISGSPTSICNGSSASLSASNCAGTVNWSNGLGSGSSKTVYPASNTTYYATCTVNGVTSANSNGVTINVTSIPSGPSLSASPATITSGQSSTLSASGCSGTVSWSHALGTGTSKTVSPTSSSTTYTATCTVNGCTSGSSSVTVNVNNTVSPPTISGTPTSICNGSSASLSASNCAGTVNWNNGLGSGSSKTVYPASSTTYYATCTVNGVTSANSNGVTINVTSIPSGPSLSASPATINSGQSSTLSASGCSGTVSWSHGLGNGTSKTVSPTSSTTYTATCTVNGCTSGSSSVTVNVNNTVSPPTISGSPTSICNGSSTSLSASNCAGTVNWNNGIGSGSSKTVYPASNTTYYATCTVNGVTSANSNGVTINVTSIPSGPSLSASPSTINSGQSSTLSASGCSGTVSWSHGLGNGTSKTVSPTSSTTYTATCSVNGCISGSSSVTVNVNNTVSPPTVSGSPTSICNGSSVSLSASNCAGTVNWNNGLGSGSSKTVYPASNTTYYATCTVNGVTSANSNGVIINVTSIPSGPSLSASSSTINSGQSSTLSASGCSGTVSWSHGLGNGTSKTVSPTSSTTYTATCTVNGCISTSSSVTVSVSVPNPCSNTVSHSGNIASGTYKAGETIQSTANVATATIYQAGKSITLLPGFQAGSNEVFEARIGGCESTPMIPTNGLVAYYPFNAATGFVDQSSYNNTGTLYGSQTSISRKSPNDAYQWGGVVSFDARRYEANNATQTQFTNAMTISFWYNLSSYTGMDGYGQANTNGYHVAIGKEGDRNGFYIGISNDVANNKQYINFTNNNNYVTNFDLVGSPSGTSSANLNKWNHLTFTVFPNSIKMYINGQLINTTAATPDFSGANKGKLIIGTMKALNSSWYPFNGGIDELRLYNRSLSDTEVLSIYNAEK